MLPGSHRAPPNCLLISSGPAFGSVTILQNTNFWRFRGGRFQEVHVYMSGANVLV